jgi:MFS family permease
MGREHSTGSRAILAILAITQLISWGSIYYAFSVLSQDIGHELGLRAELTFGAYSWSLLVAGLLAAPVGMALDRIGGRIVMGSGSAVAAIGLFALASTHSATGYLLAWTILGAAMAMTLYEAAFATINREFADTPRKGISTLTLFGGFASTVFWPLTLTLNNLFGWRDTYLIYGAVHLLVCAPLHLLLDVRRRGHSAGPAREPAATRSFTLREAIRHPVFWRLAAAFSVNSFVFAALSVHLIPLLQRLGHSMTAVVAYAALIGPMQVAGRLAEMLFARQARPQVVGMITFASLPVALLFLLMLGQRQWAAAGFCLLYGLSNGIMTIVRGTVPQTLFGREHYGAISGTLAGPALLFKALGPIAIAALIERHTSSQGVLGLLLAASLLALGFYALAFGSRRASMC